MVLALDEQVGLQYISSLIYIPRAVNPYKD
jgi:hypothetical protein